MMQIYLTTLVVAISGIHSAVADCFYGDVVLHAGQTYNVPQSCNQITCQDDGSWTSVGCAAFQVDTASGWTKSDVDLSKPYPDCCPQAVPPSNASSNPVVCELDDVVLQPGETYDVPKRCERIVCQSDGNLTALGCGEFQVDTASGWTKSDVDLTKPYPDCCPKAIPPPGPQPCVVDGKIVKVGEQYDVPGYCGLNECKGDNQWIQAPCGKIDVHKGWTVRPEDPSKPYPECCAKAQPSHRHSSEYSRYNQY